MDEEQVILDDTSEQDTQPAGESETETSEEVSEGEDMEALKEKNKKLFARAKKAEEELKHLKSAPKEATKKEEPDDIRKDIAELKLSERKRQFGYEHGLSPEETDAVFRFNPNPTKDTLLDPFIKGGLQSLKSKRRVESATPSSSSRSPSINGKTWSEMTEEERAKNYTQMTKRVMK